MKFNSESESPSLTGHIPTVRPASHPPFDQPYGGGPTNERNHVLSQTSLAKFSYFMFRCQIWVLTVCM